MFMFYAGNREIQEICFEPLRAGYSQSWEGDSLTPKASITWATNDAWHTFLDWTRDREAGTIFVKENVEKSRE